MILSPKESVIILETLEYNFQRLMAHSSTISGRSFYTPSEKRIIIASIDAYILRVKLHQRKSRDMVFKESCEVIINELNRLILKLNHRK